MKRKILSLTLASVLTVSMLAGCSSGESAQETTGGSQETSSAASEETNGEKVELTMWGGWNGDQIGQLEEQLEKFNSSQDRIHVTYTAQDTMEQKLLTAIASGDVPDIVLWDRFNTSLYAPKGALMPLDDYVAKDNLDLGQFYEPAVDELTSGGKLYGIPLTVDTRVLFYNKDMFEEAGVDPASITDWNSLEEAAVKLTKWEGDVLTQAGFSLKDTGLFSTWIGQAGGSMVDETQNPPVTTFNSEEGLEVINFWDKLLNEDKVYQLGFVDGFGGDGFKAGKVAMTFNGPWVLEQYKEAGINFGVIEPPAGPNGDKHVMMGGFGLAIPNQAKHPDEAWEFIKWWTTQPENGVEFCKISGNMPANKEAAADPYFAEDEYFPVFNAAFEYADIRSKAFGYADLETLALIPQLQKFQAGEVSAEEALANAQSQGDSILAEAAQQ